MNLKFFSKSISEHEDEEDVELNEEDSLHGSKKEKEKREESQKPYHNQFLELIQQRKAKRVEKENFHWKILQKKIQMK